MHNTKTIQIDTKQNIDAICQQILNQALNAVNAHSGSLMLVDRENEILQIKARLGEPKPRTTEPIFAIGDSSIAGHVAETGKSYLCQDVEVDKYFAHPRSGYLGFNSMLSVPIAYECIVIGVINADDPAKNYFSEYHKKVLQEIAKQASQPIAERIQRMTILDSLFEVGAELTKLPTTGGTEAVLKKIAQAAVESLNIDLVTLYQYNQGRDVFLVEGSGPTTAGKLYSKEYMRTKVYKSDVPAIVVKERKSGFYQDISKHDFLTGNVERPGQKERPRFVEREGIRSMAALLLPNRAGKDPTEEVFGLMFANYRTLHEFTADEQKNLATFADFAAVAIQNIRYEEKRASEQIAFVQSIAASFAHKMSNLAGTIPVTVQQLKEKIDPKKNFIHKQLDSIENDVRVLLALSKRLAKPFKEEDMLDEVTTVEINKLLDEIIVQAQNRSREVAIIRYYSKRLPKIMTIKSQLREVFDNIIMNALEAIEMEYNPSITLRTTFNEKTQKTEVEISNNGPPISNDIRGKIFTLGVTTKKEKALGIGLWWCRTYMRAIGGDVLLLSSDPPQFRVIIPQLYRRDIHFNQDQQKLPIDILIVDDQVVWLNKINEILRDLKYSVQVALNYTEAKEALKSYTFKLAILDIRLTESPSNTDGLELIGEIENSSLITNFIIITGYGKEEYQQIARRSKRFIDFLSKEDFNLNSFKISVERGMEQLLSHS